MADAPDSDILLETPLAALHRELGARMVPFSGSAGNLSGSRTEGARADRRIRRREPDSVPRKTG